MTEPEIGVTHLLRLVARNSETDYEAIRTTVWTRGHHMDKGGPRHRGIHLRVARIEGTYAQGWRITSDNPDRPTSHAQILPP